jgi:hypothetical protein
MIDATIAIAKEQGLWTLVRPAVIKSCDGYRWTARFGYFEQDPAFNVSTFHVFSFLHLDSVAGELAG